MGRTPRKVEVLFHSLVTDVLAEGPALRGAVFSSRNGTNAALGKRVIDCTGHVLLYTGRNLGKELPGDQLLLNVVRMLEVDPIDPKSLSRAEMLGRRYARVCADFYRRYVPGCKGSYFLDISAQLGVRASRRVSGMATLTAYDVWNLRKFDDAVAKGAWEIDIHPANSYQKRALPDSTRYKEWIQKVKEGDYYDIRYGSLVPRDVENLCVAGRCISAEHSAQGSLRIQQTCMSLGYAAGAAGALSTDQDIPAKNVDPAAVQKILIAHKKTVKPVFAALEHSLR